MTNKTTDRLKGFTLIELVTVIIILAILAVVALPRFINMGSEAKSADIHALAGSLKSSISMLHNKAEIENKAHQVSSNIDGVNLVYGYPAADISGIYQTLNQPKDWHLYSGSMLLKGVAAFTLDPIDNKPNSRSDSDLKAALETKCFVLYNWTEEDLEPQVSNLRQQAPLPYWHPQQLQSIIPGWIHDGMVKALCYGLSVFGVDQYLHLCRKPAPTPDPDSGSTPDSGGNNQTPITATGLTTPEVVTVTSGC